MRVVMWGGLLGALGFAVWLALGEVGLWSTNLNFGGEYGGLLGRF